MQNYRKSNFKNLTLVVILIIAQIQAQDFNYINKGSDWTGTCLSGSLQSPIDISDVQGSCDNTMNLTMQLSNQNLSTQILKSQVLSSTAPANQYWSYLYASNLDGVISGYQSNYFSIHSPAENYLNGSQADVELQILHTINPNFAQTAPSSSTEPITQYAIVSIMFSVSDSSTSTFFSSYDPTKASAQAASAPQISLNMTQALSSLDLTSSYYLYQGSLTIPPCTESVNWYVYSAVQPITSAQLSNISIFFKGDLQFAKGAGNNRPLQSVNGRTIKKGNIQCEEQFIHFFSFFVIYTFLNFFVCKML
ncbi:eukaryotic-type carbonate dehydratase (macronuclear) [Tetrahymena thermophila SB210]|uniref:Eukaryotic-type carbonate dehydratase n=1 Tax=Tetrahymena thermophila (strain SB210) TaxID=312017 RepID=I7MHD1_TETTS|nr:eukaryotic-type carbonate dehydratase [Tetrahymena thermophila SB210]EAS02862.1 eukaryotic-type carbonate dehydratase [Tetrahymena thermophila SB210]|eukprot:XP_001023107.1 eukaryotic-type carbonate dehydratase [Tetrahymena thermophila SB210]